MKEDIQLGEGKKCFIVSPIGSKLDPVGSPGRSRYEESAFMWENVFQPACERFGLTPVRADKISEAGEIPDQIFTYLRDAEVVIADVSHANPNVMYELGLRHTRPGITLQIGEYKRLPFDVTTIRTIQFNRTESGLITARDDLIDQLRSALNGGGTSLRVTSIWGGSPTVESRIAADVAASTAEDESWSGETPGFMDVLAEGEAAVNHIVEVMNNAGDLTTRVGDIMTSHVALIGDSDARSQGFAGRLNVARSLSKELAEPATKLEEVANEFYDDTQSLGAMGDYVVARVQSDTDAPSEKDALIDFLRSYLTLVDAADEAAVGVVGFRESVRGMRSSSKDLRPTLQVLDRATTRILEGFATITSWRDALTEVIQ